MSAPEIPEDIMRAAENALDNLLCNCREAGCVRADSIVDIAKAVLAERERCAQISESNNHFPDEGMYIAKLIRTPTEPSNHEFQTNGPGVIGSDLCTVCGKERQDHKTMVPAPDELGPEVAANYGEPEAEYSHKSGSPLSRLAMRIFIQLRPITEHGDETALYVSQANELAAAIAEYTAAIVLAVSAKRASSRALKGEAALSKATPSQSQLNGEGEGK